MQFWFYIAGLAMDDRDGRRQLALRHGNFFALVIWILLAPRAVHAAAIELARADALPFSLTDNRIIVPVTVNDRGPHQFVFDTGGSNILDLSVARELGLTLEGASEARGAGAASQQAWTASVDRATVGPVTMSSQTFRVLSLDAIRRAIGFRRLDGIVGRELIDRFVVDIDYGNSTLQFIDRTRWTPSPAWAGAMPLTFLDGIPAVQATVDGRSGTFIIDTGDRSSLTLFGPFVKHHRLRERYQRRVRAITGWGVGGPIPADVTRVMNFSLGAYEVRQVVTRMPTLETGGFATSEAAGSIGNGILKRFQVAFDYRSKRMLLVPNAAYGKPDPADRSGLWLSLADGGFQVMSVVAGSPAAASGIRVDDIVTAVDGVAAVDLFLVDLRERLKVDEAGSSVRLKLKTTNGEREVVLTLRDLI